MNYIHLFLLCLMVEKLNESGEKHKSTKKDEIVNQTRSDLYEKDLSLSPFKIPLEDISVDVQNFQNRKKPYSEHSVQNIVNAVTHGEFDFRIFNPIILRKDNKTSILYVLAGHSRFEAFKRLRTSYNDHPTVIQFQKRTGYDFSHIPALILDDIHFDTAKMISLMSNALASGETDVERADVYRSFRDLGKDIKFIESFGQKCEKSNRRRIRAYSYLNPEGKMLDTVERFELGEEDNHTIKKIAYRLGSLRKKYNKDLSDVHEHELCEWLLNGGYGNQKGQINTLSKFMEITSKHIENLKNTCKLYPNKLLNILGIESLSLCMREYYQSMEKIKNLKRKLYADFHFTRRKYNKNIIEHGGEKGTKELLLKLEKKINQPIDVLIGLEQAEAVLININEIPIASKDRKKAMNSILDHINGLEQEYYRLKNNKDTFLALSKKEIQIEFPE